MKKIFRMANAELSKIFMRPSMFVLTGVLVIALIFSYFFFAPAENNTKFTYNLTNTTSIYTQFQKDYNDLEQQLVTAKKEIDDYIADTGDVYNTYAEDFHSLKTYFYGDGYYTIINLAGNLTSSDFNKCVTVFSTLRGKTKNLTDYMVYNIKNRKINSYFY